MNSYIMKFAILSYLNIYFKHSLGDYRQLNLALS